MQEPVQHPALNSVKVMMSNLESKLTRYMKKRWGGGNTRKISQEHLETTEMMELTDRDFKIVIINVIFIFGGKRKTSII